MGKCLAITRNGAPCQGVVRPGSDCCISHDPSRSEQRKAAASRAATAKAKPIQEIRQLKHKLIKLGDDVLKGEVSRANAAVAAQAWGVAVRACEAEVKYREYQEVTLPEFQEVIGRLEAIEAAQQRARERGSWAG